jgi:REP element-mobilizing transposase RayT
MSHSRYQNLIHCVYSTLHRENSIPTALLGELWAYNFGTGKNRKIPVLAVGGIENHIHLCIALPPTMCLADAVSTFKSNSSRWLKEKGARDFSWQTGYGAFSISPPQFPAVRRYIDSQREHHKKRTYEEEFLELLKRAGISYDPQDVFD